MAATLAALCGCVKGEVVTAPDGEGPLTAEIVSGGTPSDTAGARIGEPVVVRVVNAEGTGLENREVSIAAHNTLPGVFVRETLDGPDLSGFVAWTDRSGQVSAYVTLRETVGEGLIDFRPTGHLASPVRVTAEILPANAVTIELTLAARTAEVDERVAYGGAAFDQHGNTVSTMLTYSVNGPAALVGGSIVGTGPGVAWLIGQYESAMDSIDLTISAAPPANASSAPGSD